MPERSEAPQPLAVRRGRAPWPTQPRVGRSPATTGAPQRSGIACSRARTAARRGVRLHLRLQLDTGDRLQGDLFLGFEVNAIHPVIHVAPGLVLIAGSPRRPSARFLALGFGLVYGLVAIIGLIDGEDVLGLIPINPADNLLHIALAALGFITGLLSRDDDRGRGATVLDRDTGSRFEREAAPTRPERTRR